MMDQDGEFRKRQERVSAGVPAAVVHAMDSWVEWMGVGTVGCGYPHKTAGISSGGINCFDDMDHAAAEYAAKSVDGVYKGLNPIFQLCIGVVWLGHKFDCEEVEKLAADAMRIIWRGLAARGVV